MTHDPVTCPCGCHDGYGNPCTIPGGCGLTTAPDPVEGACVRGCHVPRRHLTSCSTPACRGCQPRPATHGALCWPCHRRLELMLTDAPALEAWVSVHLPAGSRPKPATQVRIRRTKGEPPLPIDLDILDMAEQILASLTGWVGLLVEDTSLTGPTRHDVPALSAYLLVHLGAVECQPWIKDAWEEIAFVTDQAHSLAPWRPELRRCKGIPCPECQAPALAIFGGQDDVQCLECRTLIPPERYNLWTRMLADEAAS